jgi:hypothetical protein
MEIEAPEEDDEDATTNPGCYDEAFGYLVSIGIEII